MILNMIMLLLLLHVLTRFDAAPSVSAPSASLRLPPPASKASNNIL